MRLIQEIFIVEIGPMFKRSTEARRSSFLNDSFSVIAVTTRVGPWNQAFPTEAPRLRLRKDKETHGLTKDDRLTRNARQWVGDRYRLRL